MQYVSCLILPHLDQVGFSLWLLILYLECAGLLPTVPVHEGKRTHPSPPDPGSRLHCTLVLLVLEFHSSGFTQCAFFPVSSFFHVAPFWDASELCIWIVSYYCKTFSIECVYHSSFFCLFLRGHLACVQFLVVLSKTADVFMWTDAITSAGWIPS